MNTQPLDKAQVEQFSQDGFLMIKEFLSSEETELLIRTVRGGTNLMDHAVGSNDTQGRSSKLSLWNHPTDDIYGRIARSHKVVDAAEQLLGDEVYHYHSKLMLKEAKVGGAWEWHQDYGYWYDNGCLYPDMLSCFIAIDRACKENGCLQVLKGSHSMGRIEHGRYGGQTGANPDRVEEIKKRLELVYCEMDPGTALFFHSNLLHRSDANLSDKSRWGLIHCYNSVHNNPYKESHHPCYTPLEKVPNESIIMVGSSTNPDCIFDASVINSE